MKPIAQEDPFGCSLACVAFLLGRQYQEIVKLVDKKRAQTRGFYCRDLIGLLSKLGLDYDYKYLKPRFRRKIYSNNVIVFIKRSKQYPSGHYLARLNGLWMDPWINFKPSAKIQNANAGFRKKLPGKPIYALLPLAI